MMQNFSNMNIILSDRDFSLLLSKTLSNENKLIHKPLPTIPPPPSIDFGEKSEKTIHLENEKIQAEIPLAHIPILSKLPQYIWEKNNIYKAPDFLGQNLNVNYNTTQQVSHIPREQKPLKKIPATNDPLLSKKSKKIQKEKSSQLTRKIVKNYGKAIASFACSEKAQPLLDKLLKKNQEFKKKFVSFVYENKEFIEGNRRLRHLLTVFSTDDGDVKRNKRVLKVVAELFMKKYVHQWLWNSKLVNKELHAQLICDMRKRIKFPDQLEHLSN
jgi:hypothetical protein